MNDGAPPTSVVEALLQELLRVPTEKTHVEAALARRFIDTGYPELIAAELAQAHRESLVDRLEEELRNFDSEGAKRPLVLSGSGGVVFGVQHRRLHKGPASSSFQVADYVSSADEHQLLGLTCLYSVAIGCERVYVCDKGGGDAGLDVIAGSRSRSLQSVHALYAWQCKAYAAPLAKSDVDALYGRYKFGLDEPVRWAQYLSALGAADLAPAPARIFGVVASHGLSRSGRQAAVQRGVLGVSMLVLSQTLARSWTLDSIQDYCARVPKSRDLSRNMALEVPRPLGHG